MRLLHSSRLQDINMVWAFELQLESTEEKVEALEVLTEDAGSLGTIEVAASVTVLVTTTDDVGGNITVRLCMLISLLHYGKRVNFRFFRS